MTRLKHLRARHFHFMVFLGLSWLLGCGDGGEGTPLPDSGVDAGLPPEDGGTGSTTDVQPPLWPAGSSLSAEAAGPSRVMLRWTAAEDDVEVVAYRVFRDTAEVGRLSGSSERELVVEGLDRGATHAFRVEAADGEGNISRDGPSRTLTLQTPRPEEVAPEQDETVVPSFEESMAFLYSGPNPVQVGVEQGVLEERRLAVLRGQVKTQTGAPLSGVQVSVLGHPEFGSTETREDGLFDMAVNGGGLLVVQYEKEGYLPSQRQVQTPWEDFARVPEVVLVALDSRVTEVKLTNPDIQVAQGNPVEDKDGRRQATVLFHPGTEATMELPDGSTRRLGTLHVRATEYTVGEAGPASMPGALPPASGYTYAVELSVDEALAAGASSVRFSQPVSFYVDNFLGFPVGGLVPTGYYDRAAGVWRASENGRILQVVGSEGGVALVDVTGDGAADEVDALSALGITREELQRLAQLYSAGQSLWRVPIRHFTPWDCNWPYGPPGDATPPGARRPTNGQPENDPNCQTGSVIDCQNQTLGESVELVGTPFRLHYSSSRAPGRRTNNVLKIPLSEETVPGSLQSIVLEVEVAGQHFRKSFPASPRQHYTFEWDGKDAYGRPQQGPRTAKVRVGYVYQLVYQEPVNFAQSFGRLSGFPLSAQRGQREMTVWRTWESKVGDWQVPVSQLGGWSLGIHHAYDAANRILLQGNGERHSVDGRPALITTIAGTGVQEDSGDNGPATQASILPAGLAVGPDGSIYLSSRAYGYRNPRIRRITPDGLITAFPPASTSNGDVGTLDNFKYDYVAVAPDGSIHYALDINIYKGISRVGTDGIETHLAGRRDSIYQGKLFLGDGGPAIYAQFNRLQGVAVGVGGGVYAIDSHRIRHIAPDGIIQTIAGTGIPGYSGDGGPATLAQFSQIYDVEAGPDGSLYIADSWNHRIRRIGPDGIITTIAGTGVQGFSGDDGPARLARLSSPEGIALGPDGSLYIADSGNNRVRRVDPDGTISTLAGTGLAGYGGDNGPAAQAQLDRPTDVAVGPSGNVYIADLLNSRIRRVSRPLPERPSGELLLPSENGREVYVFDRRGRHLRTLDALTKALRHEFGYDASGLLIWVKDGDGLMTRIERDGGGTATAIVAPNGQRTLLEMGLDSYLASITNPAGEVVSFDYQEGLLTSMRDARGGLHAYAYGALGRLIRDTNPEGGFKALERQEEVDGFITSVTTALGATSLYRIENLPGGKQLRTQVSPTGQTSTLLRGPDGVRVSTAADGTVITSIQGADPVFGVHVPLETYRTARTPSGLTATYRHTRAATFTDPGDLLGFATLTDVRTLNGRAFTSVYEAVTRRISRTSPLGRSFTLLLDEKGRVREEQVAGLLPIQYGYDGEGRLSWKEQGIRRQDFTYNAEGYLQGVKDVLGRTSTFTYDLAGRVSTRTLPGNRQLAFRFDASGNLTSLAPPERPEHTFLHTLTNREAAYFPPVLPDVPAPQSETTYTLDGQPESRTFPDGTRLALAYTAGRLDTSSLTPPSSSPIPARTLSATYDVVTGHLTSLNDSWGTSLHYGYDGFLPLSEEWRGTVAGSVQRSYTPDFLLNTLSVGGQSFTFGHDADGLLTQAGALIVSRDASSGFVTGTSLGGVTTTHGVNGYGEVESFSSAFQGSSPLLQYTLVRDEAGRIVEKTESTAGSVSVHFLYGHDEAGRLTTVTRDGVLLAQYSYDGQGNRTSAPLAGSTVAATYDEQDRLRTFGPYTYTFEPNGSLQVKQSGPQTTRYTHDAFGRLLAVELPNGTRIDYVLDAKGRRIGKRVNGVPVQGFLYDGQLRVVAELDGAGQVVSRFVYGTRSHTPDYVVKGGLLYRIVSDHLGSPRLVVEVSSGAVVQRLNYDAWGGVLENSAPDFQPFGFAGGLLDLDTGLVHFGAREYEPESGRWTAKDPIRFEGGDSNLYAYVFNDPLNRIDPSGLDGFGVQVGIEYGSGGASGNANAGGVVLVDEDGNVETGTYMSVGTGNGTSLLPSSSVNAMAFWTSADRKKDLCGPSETVKLGFNQYFVSISVGEDAVTIGVGVDSNPIDGPSVTVSRDNTSFF